MVRRALAGVAIACLSACAGASATHEPLSSLPRPPGADASESAFEEFARRAFDSVKRGTFDEVQVSELELRALLDPESATRASHIRASGRTQLARDAATASRAWGHATFRAACGQGAYEEPAGGRLGLSRPAWVVERVLLVGVDGASGPTAAWIEGRFVLTNRGFVAVEIARLEAPRPHHSDLELASCEISTGWEVHNRLGLSVPEIH